MKEAATKSYSKKGEAIVKMNHDAIECGVKEVKKVKVPEGMGQGGGRRSRREAGAPAALKSRTISTTS